MATKNFLLVCTLLSSSFGGIFRKVLLAGLLLYGLGTFVHLRRKSNTKEPDKDPSADIKKRKPDEDYSTDMANFVP